VSHIYADRKTGTAEPVAYILVVCIIINMHRSLVWPMSRCTCSWK